MRFKIHYPGTILNTCVLVYKDNNDILTNAFTKYVSAFICLYISLIELTMCRQSVHTNVSLKEGLLTVKGTTISGPSPTSP